MRRRQPRRIRRHGQRLRPGPAGPRPAQGRSAQCRFRRAQGPRGAAPGRRLAAPRGRARRLPRFHRGQRYRHRRGRCRGDRRLHRQRRAEGDRGHGQALYPVRARCLQDIDLRQGRLPVRFRRLDQAAQAGRPPPLQWRCVPGPRRRLREKPRRRGHAGLRLRHRRGRRPGPLRIQEQACRGPGQAAPSDVDRRGAAAGAAGHRRRRVIRSVVQGCGAYLPDRIVTNDELAKKVDTSDEWIQQRTGIKQRHIAADGEFTSHLAIKASERALAHAGLKASDLDLIILATATPDETFPATATRVQAALGMTKGAAFDVQAVCAGLVYAVSVADSMITSGAASTALVLAAETYSRILDWNDRGTCVLFGDGAGAIVMRGEEGKGTSADRGVLANALHSDGRQHDILYVDGGPSSTRTTGFLRMEGKEVFKQAVVNMAAVVGEVLDKVGLAPKDIDWLVPHQANKRIIDGTGRKLGLKPERVVITVDRHANTSAASIPLALDSAVKDGRIKKGDLLLLEGIGGGLAWGASLIRW